MNQSQSISNSLPSESAISESVTLESAISESVASVDDAQDSKQRDQVFWQAMQEFLGNPEACLHSQSSILSELIYGWGNDWSAQSDYLVSCIQAALSVNGPILECGSGLSTLLIGAIAQRRKSSLWTLEHTPTWASKVQTYLHRCCIDVVQLCCQPLHDYGDFEWYAPPLSLMTEPFALVICDGPPGTTKGGRYGLVPVMRAKLQPGCVILLDDASREPELIAAQAWERELEVGYELIDCPKPFIRIILP